MNSLVSRRIVIASLPAIALAASLGCCCQRKGLVLRGDWSLELNRVPHMRSNGPTYSGDCAAPAGCTSTSCTCGQCLSAADSGAEYYESYADGSGYGHGGMLPGRVGHGGFEGGAGHESLQDPTPPALARFHPVPTRPVFEPQAVAYAPEIGAPAVPRLEQLPHPQAGSGRRSSPQSRDVQRATEEFGAVEAEPAEAQFAQQDSAQQNSLIQQASYSSPADSSDSSNSRRFTTAPQKNSVTWKVARRRA
ncbi:MAG: hypothetical protein JNK76_07845 [Planctomycetales bacterium]|nr:hypothetical protein [Planctomycetales bacterium]MBN8627936.1 hypothetical protein [Planctomycetota bacterium]